MNLGISRPVQRKEAKPRSDSASSKGSSNSQRPAQRIKEPPSIKERGSHYLSIPKYRLQPVLTISR